ncbi:hypothetical protein TNCV_2359301 [Trichonephila clavipes]|nr:hypothetical protein TNCV_2359301 [Trichonephila clavipes]
MLTLNLDLSLKTTWFHSAAVRFPRPWHHCKRRRRWVGVKGSTRNGRNALQPGAFVWLEKTQGLLVKRRLTKLLTIRVHFLRSAGLLDNWFVEGVLSLVIV